MAFDDSGGSTPAPSAPRPNPMQSMSKIRIWVTVLGVTGAVVFIAGWFVEQMLSNLVDRMVGVDLTAAARLHSSLCLAAAVALSGLQVIVIWRLDLGKRWWYPIVTEVALAVGIAVASVQALGSTSTSCSPSSRCITMYPPLIEWRWFILCVIVGMVIGASWARATQQSRSER